MVPLVSISCITYNHEKYITQALDGFLLQQTSFPIEILIYDDASTDNTQKIIRGYETKYPDIIRTIYQKENQYSKGVRGIAGRFNFSRARGKYIALCEGDDYWTDPLKLQKQVDFLEKNPEYSMCSHEVEIIYEADWIGTKKERFNQSVKIAGFEDILDNHFIPTNSLVFRNGLIKEWPRWMSSKYMISGDIPMELMLSYHGKSYFSDEKMAVKRINGGGITSNKARQEKVLYFRFELYYHINNYTRSNYKPIILPKMLEIFRTVLKKSIARGDAFLAIKHIFYLLHTTLRLRY
ncbi:MAG: glycosyltransferase [Bacteroidales bacterium]|nr:glycosyltransferase [Bacteroidales bacterium]